MSTSGSASFVSGAMLRAGAAQGEAQAAALKRAKMKKACQMFESHFLFLMWKEMRKTVHKTGLISGGHAEQIFTDMMDQAVADASAKGRSMGLADMLERQLTRERTTRLPSPAERRMRAKELAPRANFYRGRIVYPRHGGPAGVDKETSSLQAARRGGHAAAMAPGLVSPLRGRITSLFGMRTHPITGKLAHHDGVDVAAPQGSQIKAAAAGRVVFAGRAGGYGNLVEIEHPDGRTTRYGHCAKLKVREGQKVAAGQVIATVGSTGLSTGPHLHFEIINAQGRHIDPMKMVAFTAGPYA